MQKMSNGRYPSRNKRISLCMSIQKDIKQLLEQFHCLECNMDNYLLKQLKEARHITLTLAESECKNAIDHLLKGHDHEKDHRPHQQSSQRTDHH